MIFNDEQAVFEPLKHWDIHDPHDSAHPFRARADGVEYVYLFPNWRVKADLESVRDLKNYEALTCIDGDGRVRGKETKVDRDGAGRPRYRWKAGADRLDPGRTRELISAGKLKPEENWIDLHDFETGTRVEAGRGSVYWNDYRRRWVMLNSSTKAGELWFAEADTPVGPWRYARRVVTHGDYNFYNPTQHPFFDQQNGKFIYFEGTYSEFFSGARTPTPRYDYNQLMYRLALNDPRLALPVAVYRVRGTNGPTQLYLRAQVELAEAWERVEDVPWFALPPTSPGEGLIPVFAENSPGTRLSLSAPTPDARPLFVGLPLIEPQPAFTLAGPWECRATQPGKEDFKFPLRFSLQGETVRVEDLGPDTTGAGTFHDGKLVFVLRTRDATYAVEARPEKRSLHGTWRQEGGAAKGSWSASPIDSTPPERRSAALTVLKEYRRLSDGRTEYSVQSPPPAGYAPTGKALCRVWNGPGPMMIADWKAHPVPEKPN
jgi:hypothetical protein